TNATVLALVTRISRRRKARRMLNAVAIVCVAALLSATGVLAIARRLRATRLAATAHAHPRGVPTVARAVLVAGPVAPTVARADASAPLQVEPRRSLGSQLSASDRPAPVMPRSGQPTAQRGSPASRPSGVVNATASPSLPLRT